MNNFSSFSIDQLESIKVYLEHCRKGLEESKGNGERLQNIVKELAEVNEEIFNRSEEE